MGGITHNPDHDSGGIPPLLNHGPQLCHPLLLVLVAGGQVVCVEPSKRPAGGSQTGISERSQDTSCLRGAEGALMQRRHGAQLADALLM